MTTSITLCADDYGLDVAIDSAVIHLAKLGRLNATSCMTDSPRWHEAAPPLKALLESLPEKQFEVGLHFNLTEGYQNGKYQNLSLNKLIWQSWSRIIDPKMVRQRLAQQLDAFERAMGRAPDYLDGHQHIHQFPVIRNNVLAVLQQRYGAKNRVPTTLIQNHRHPIWFRSTVPAPGLDNGKAQLIARLGGVNFAQQLDARGLAHNSFFAGVYAFDAPDETAYGLLMANWLNLARPGMLMMCHPAMALVPSDAIARARTIEYAYLTSENFTQALQAAKISLVSQTHYRNR